MEKQGKAKALTCRDLKPARKSLNQSSKEVYYVNEEENIVHLHLLNTEFGTIRTEARCQDTDDFNAEVGMRVAKLKAIRYLARLQKARIRESIENKKKDIERLNLMLRRQDRTIKRMDKIIPKCGYRADDVKSDVFYSMSE